MFVGYCPSILTGDSDETKPTVSKDFTIDDIHKIREWHYEQRKEMGMDKLGHGI